MKSIIVIVSCVLFTFFMAYQSYQFGQYYEQQRVEKAINTNQPLTEVEKYSTVPIKLAIIVPCTFWFILGFILYLYDAYKEKKETEKYSKED